MVDKKDNPNKVWEKVTPSGSTYRLKVGGGWLYRYDFDGGSSVAFVPDVYTNEIGGYNHLHRIADLLGDLREGRKHNE